MSTETEANIIEGNVKIIGQTDSTDETPTTETNQPADYIMYRGYLDVFQKIKEHDFDYITQILKNIQKKCHLLKEKFDGVKYYDYATKKYECNQINKWKIKIEKNVFKKYSVEEAEAILNQNNTPIEFVFNYVFRINDETKLRQLKDYQNYANNLRIELKKYKIHVTKKYDLIKEIEKNEKHNFFTHDIDIDILKSIIVTYVKLNELYLRYDKINPDSRIGNNGFSKSNHFKPLFIKEIQKITKRNYSNSREDRRASDNLPFIGFNAGNCLPRNIEEIIEDIHEITDIEKLKKLIKMIDIKTLVVIATDYLPESNSIKTKINNRIEKLESAKNRFWEPFSHIDHDWWLTPIDNEWRFKPINKYLFYEIARESEPPERIDNYNTDNEDTLLKEAKKTPDKEGKVLQKLKFRPVDETSLLTWLIQKNSGIIPAKYETLLENRPINRQVFVSEDQAKEELESLGINIEELNWDNYLETLGLNTEELQEWNKDVDLYFETKVENREKIKVIETNQRDLIKIMPDQKGGLRKTLKQTNHKKRKSHKKRMPYKTYRKVNQKRKTRKYVR